MRFMLKGKIHRATVTDADIAYDGSIGIDPDLLEAADMLSGEQAHVLNIDNGERFVTYIIEDTRGSGAIAINGAAARKATVGDKVIILTYEMVDEQDARANKPRLGWVDDNNKIARRSP